MTDSKRHTIPSCKSATTQTSLLKRCKIYDKLLRSKRKKGTALGPDTSCCGQISLSESAFVSFSRPIHAHCLTSLVLAATMNIGQQLTGNNSLATYSTIIYKKVFTSNSQIQLINALAGTFNILFTLNATWMTDLVGRRPLLLVGVAGLAVCMFSAAAVVTETPTLEDGSKSPSVGIATVFLMFLFAFFFKPSWGATVWIWTSEIFSMNIRAQAVAMTTQCQSIASIILRKFPCFAFARPLANRDCRTNLPHISFGQGIVSYWKST